MLHSTEATDYTDQSETLVSFQVQTKREGEPIGLQSGRRERGRGGSSREAVGLYSSDIVLYCNVDFVLVTVDKNGAKMKKRGFCGIGIYHPKTTENVGTLWRSAYLWDVDFLFTIGARYHKQPTDTPDVAKHIPLYTYTDFIDFTQHVPQHTELVCIEQTEKGRPLAQVHHPERALYLLGAEDYGIPEEYMLGYQTISIPTSKSWSLNVAIAGSLVLYDRYTKEQELAG